MKSLGWFIVVVYVSVFLTLCDKKENSVTLTTEYMPLEIGNYWQLDYTYRKEFVGTNTPLKRNTQHRASNTQR
jgi:uncharacterized lipoprotein YehR (DUF1307 family)